MQDNTYYLFVQGTDTQGHDRYLYAEVLLYPGASLTNDACVSTAIAHALRAEWFTREQFIHGTGTIDRIINVTDEIHTLAQRINERASNTAVMLYVPGPPKTHPN